MPGGVEHEVRAVLPPQARRAVNQPAQFGLDPDVQRVALGAMFRGHEVPPVASVYRNDLVITRQLSENSPKRGPETLRDRPTSRPRFIGSFCGFMGRVACEVSLITQRSLVQIQPPQPIVDARPPRPRGGRP